MNKKYFYITTPIYYPNSKLHIGHCYTTVLADILARYKKMKGYEVFFLTGSDEHGQKIMKSAEISNKKPKEFVDEIIEYFKELWLKLGIEYNHFIRTTDKDHQKSAKAVFSNLYQQDDLYFGQYQGHYCSSCEEFLTVIQIEKDKCIVCSNEVKKISEDTYFFKTSKYVDQLLQYYEKHPDFVTPNFRINEMINSFIKPGLSDLSVTRTNVPWAIKTKEDPKHTIYVWLDALSNYLTAIGYPHTNKTIFKKFWGSQCEVVHLLAKEITRFHAIYWPMILMALKLRLPNKLLVHSWITTKGEKMSKSKGNFIDPLVLINLYSRDAVRFFLAKEVQITRDSNYTHQLFLESYNSNLVNDLGNLLSRTMTMITKFFNGKIPNFEITKNDNDKILRTHIEKTIVEYQKEMDQYNVSGAITYVFDLISSANKYIDIKKPWNLFKENEILSLKTTLNNLTQVLRVSAYLLSPILIDASEIICDQLNINFRQLSFSNLTKFNSVDNLEINDKKNLFNRLNIDDELEKLNKLL